MPELSHARASKPLHSAGIRGLAASPHLTHAISRTGPTLSDSSFVSYWRAISARACAASSALLELPSSMSTSCNVPENANGAS